MNQPSRIEIMARILPLHSLSFHDDIEKRERKLVELNGRVIEHKLDPCPKTEAELIQRLRLKRGRPKRPDINKACHNPHDASDGDGIEKSFCTVAELVERCGEKIRLHSPRSSSHNAITQLQHDLPRIRVRTRNLSQQTMTNSQKTTEHEFSMSARDAIYHRRSVRNYEPQTLDQAVIRMLLDAAVQAPTAMHEEPWSFVIIQDKSLLNRLSDSAKEQVRREAQGSNSLQAKHTLHLVDGQDFHVFYNVGTLIVIYGKFQGPFVVADCWLAAENLMLAAFAEGLGTCVIGFAVSALNTPEWKTELRIPAKMTAIAPIIVGVPAGETPPVPRKQPEILFWK